MAYHHGDARTALLQAAADLLEQEGAAGLSLRQVAERAGLSRQAPYNHFANKEALLADVAADGFRDLDRRMAEGSGDPAPFERLVVAAESYIRFGSERPALFRLMFSRELVDLREHPAAQEAATATFAHLQRIVAALDPAGDAGDATLVSWSLVHGYTDLCVEAEIEEPARRAERARLFARAVAALIRSGGGDRG
jgi:AcrR family transcriptional regulator